MTKHWCKLAIFEKQSIRRMFGVQLAFSAMLLSVVSLPTHAFDYSVIEAGLIEEKLVQVPTKTNSAYSFPLKETLGMSQGYHGLHPGVDLRAPKGTGVVAVADGVVIQVEQMTFGYGHYIRIAHSGTMSSLYAHLGSTSVQSGQKVVKGEKIGEVGMTGKTTGPHLHFEVMVGDKTVNPLGFISQ